MDERALAVREIVAPVVAQLGEILERTNTAMERMAAQQQVMAARITDLERQLRLKTPLSKAQETRVNEAIRARAAEIAEARGFQGDRRLVNKLAALIRKAILSRYGVATLREAPGYDYETAIEQARRWNDFVAMREALAAARARQHDDDDV